jgi:hypothetical protein
MDRKGAYSGKLPHPTQAPPPKFPRSNAYFGYMANLFFSVKRDGERQREVEALALGTPAVERIRGDFRDDCLVRYDGHTRIFCANQLHDHRGPCACACCGLRAWSDCEIHHDESGHFCTAKGHAH